MNTPPLVSVLMAAYNSEKYISEAIESVLVSSYSNFELIICDDRSTDKTATLAQSYQKSDNRVKVYVNEVNLGDYPNRNRAASYAKGKYLKFLDHDDMIYPWGLEAMVMCMEKYPEAGFGLMSHGNLPQEKIYPILVTPLDAYRSYFFKGALFAMGPTGAIFRKDAFDAVKGFSGKPFVGDQEMWLTMARSFPLVRMPLDLIWWREHGAQESKRELKDIAHVVRRFQVSKEALSHPDCPLPNPERGIALRNHYNIRVRNIITHFLFRLKIAQAFKQFKDCGLSWTDLIMSLRKNQNPYKN